MLMQRSLHSSVRHFRAYRLFILFLFYLFASKQTLAQSYAITNLGSLGGGFSNPLAINNNGKVVGSSYLADNQTYHAFLWQNGKMTDLGKNLGGIHSLANSINDRGDVAGYWNDQAGHSHAFLWKKGKSVYLGNLGGGDSNTTAINNLDQIVGTSNTVSGNEHAYIWQNKHMTDIGTLQGSYRSIALDINNNGTVLCEAFFTDGTNYSQYAFLWNNGVITNLGQIGVDFMIQPVKINDSGSILGGGQGGASIWQNGDIKSLGTLPYSTQGTQAINFNNSDYAVGWADVHIPNIGFAQDAWVYQNGVMSDLRYSISEPWHMWSANAVNSHGQIVAFGRYNDTPFGFLLTPIAQAIQITNINASNFSLTSATINWNTNTNSNSVVEYGTPDGYGQTASSNSLTTSHHVTLTNLKPYHIYHYRVQSITTNGLAAVSEDRTFVANNLPIFYITYGNIRKNANNNYLIDLTFSIQGDITIPKVTLHSTSLGYATTPISPIVPDVLISPFSEGTSKTITLTFPASSGASGTRVLFTGEGWTGNTFGDPGFGFYNYTYRVTLP